MEFNYGKSKSYSRNCQRTLLNVGTTLTLGLFSANIESVISASV
jgi:hypothetical protein